MKKMPVEQASEQPSLESKDAKATAETGGVKQAPHRKQIPAVGQGPRRPKVGLNPPQKALAH